MKLTVFFMLIALTQISAKGYSQTVTISRNNIPLVKVFRDIQEQTGYHFLCTQEELEHTHKVDIEVKDAPLEDVLDDVFKDQPVTYYVLNNTIIVRHKSAHTSTAQVATLSSVHITGIVTDSTTGKPLVGVTIQVKGNTMGTVSDANGNFSLEVPDDAVLVVRYLGYTGKKILVDGKNTFHISLASSTTGLNQLVVIGYGTLKKKDVTGAISSISAKEIEARPVSNAVQAMQGRVAGVDITTNQRPGEIGDINIRGVRSLTASNSPLYVVDGIPLTTGGIGYLNPNDIGSISVLKDASATAIYGSRGANGVILITTKQGKAGHATLSYSGSVITQKLEDDAPLMNASQYITFRRWAYYYSNPSLYPRGDEPSEANDYKIFLGSSDPSAWANIMKGWASGKWDGAKVKTTCWTCMVTQTGIVSQHTLSVSGGTDKFKGYASFGYIDNKGTSKGQKYTRYSSNTNISFTPKKWFTFKANTNISYSIQNFGQSTRDNTAIASQGSIYQSARSIFTYAVPFDSAGNRIIYPGGDQAVKTAVDEWKYSTDQNKTLRAMGSFSGQVDIGAIIGGLKGLKYKINFGPDFSMYQNGVYIDGKSVIRSGTSHASLTKNETFSYTLDNILSYENEFGKHSINLTLLQTQTAYNTEGSAMSADNIPFSSQKWNALTPGNVPQLLTWSSDLTQKQLKSYLGRLNYAFNNKYLLTVSGRWDGASQLAPGHKWSFFPSAAVGWRLAQERFMQQFSWMDRLKLRLGVGTTGNSAIDPYSTKGAVSALLYPFGSTLTQGSVPSTVMANLDLGWEKTTQYDIGLDFAVLKSGISGSIDFYTAKTKDLLLSENVPSVTGFITTVANVGKTANKGFDISINTDNIRNKNLQWSTTLNASFNKDHIVALTSGQKADINNGWFVGAPINVIYGYQGDGLWKASDSALISKFNGNGSSFRPGMARPVDQNGDGKIDANNDRIVIGHTRPRWAVGMVNDVTYHQFEFSIFLYGRLGYTYDTGGESEEGRFNQRQIDYYNEDNTNAYWQAPIYSTGTGDIYYHSLGYLDGSFLEIKNISLAYNFPAGLIHQWKMHSLKVYFQVTDLGMIYSPINWINMDTHTSYWNMGITGGVNVTF
ncbi:MAG TPA: TonB-dependent receptor [Chitinophagaceae bacterium]|nr:TonB-dependent receptor [Chitinophagaceae bacterium]